MIIGLGISIWRLRVMPSIILGIVGCAASPWTVAILVSGASGVGNYTVRTLNYVSLGQTAVGAILGLLISALCSYMNRGNVDNLS